MNYMIENRRYNQVRGVLDYAYLFQAWAPDTVCESNIRDYAKTRLLQYNSALSIGCNKTASGSICVNSADSALFLKVE